MKLTRTATAVVAGSAALVLALTGCASDDNGDATANGNGTATTAADGSVEAAEDGVSLTEAYIKEKPADKGMTGIFGTFTNSTDEEVNVVGFTADFEGATFELHEVVDGVMQEKSGGFVIPAGESHELVPGGDHMMIMDYMEEIPAGDVIDITVELADGSTFDVEEIPVRTMNPGDEDYGADGSLMGHDR